VIFFGPHHDGTAVDFADEVAAEIMAETEMNASARSTAPLLLIIVRSFLSCG
jgi:hypothetical protein